MRELIDWREAWFSTEIAPSSPGVILGGSLPYPMDIELEPRRDVAGPLEYWPVEVVGYDYSGIPTVIRPLLRKHFRRQVSIESLTLGACGIELIGRSKTERIDIPGASRSR